MRTTALSLLLPALLAGGTFAADDQSSAPTRQPRLSGLSAMLDAVGKSQVPSLSGLIQPEKMGLLTDNECEVEDNEVHLLSDNEGDVDVLSNNEVNVLSGIRILSGITLNVKITIPGDGKKTKAKKAKGNHKSRKSKNTTGQKSKRR
jgi:ribosomal protein S13